MYALSSKEKPKELDGGGSGVYCCIPLCKSATYDREKNKTGIGFFKFPKRPDINKKWSSIIKQYRRSGSNDSFKIKSTTVVCEFHFKQEEIKISAGIGRKTLIPGSVPSIFKFKESVPPKKRKPPPIRIVEPIEESSESEFEDDYSVVGVVVDSHSCQSCRDREAEIERLKEKIHKLGAENKSVKEQLSNLQTENTFIEEKFKSIETRIFNYKNVSADPKLFRKMTGFETEEFSSLLDFLNPGNKNENMKFSEAARHGYPNRTS